MKGVKGLYALEGVTKFGRPTGIPGIISYNSCQLFQFQDQIPEKLLLNLNQVCSSHSKKLNIELFSNEKKSFFYASLTKNILLTSNDLELINESIQNFNRAERTFDMNIKMKELLDLTDIYSPEWAVRFYPEGERETDPTSILKPSVIFSEFDPNAIGWAYQPNKSQIIYLSTGNKSKEFVSSVAKLLKGKLKVKRPGNWAIHLDTEFNSMTNFLISALLGHAILP